MNQPLDETQMLRAALLQRDLDTFNGLTRALQHIVKAASSADNRESMVARQVLRDFLSLLESCRAVAAGIAVVNRTVKG